MDKQKLIATAIASTLALGVAKMSAANTQPSEKCYGVAKAGMNDCGNAAHSCAGYAKKDNDKTEWVYLPKGTCDKLVHGSTQPGENDD